MLLNTGKLTNIFPAFLSGILNSYTQIFFSNNRLFALILVAVSFFDFWAGLGGLIAVVVTNSMSYLIGFNRLSIKKGYYGFNSLLVGLALGVYYQPGAEFFIVLGFASLLTLFLTLMIEGVVGKYGLPFLSLSFLLGTWLVSLAARQFTALDVSERGIYMYNEMYLLGGEQMVYSYRWLTDLGIPDVIRLYFTSLGAIFFQYHLFAGILIATGLLIYSRIAFLLSLAGFFSAYGYYNFIGANIQELSYSYIGFNFILSAIAIGGFFIIPSRWSFLWVILLTPLISIILTSTQAVFSIFQLSVYSLPFNFVVLLFLYALKFRERFYDKPELVLYQQYAPEKNLYSHVNYKERFGKSNFLPVTLPFWGEWKVTQGHDGEYTHQGDWRHAWDFENVDQENKTYAGEGKQVDDYYAYGKPVIAPADGYVEEIVDDIEDNGIGAVDLSNNWGNTIVLRHSDQLYSKLSHLKKGSFRVSAGDHVKQGQVMAACGNSGRSPVPHLHFQLQETPYIGSRTLKYPISHFVRRRNGAFELISYQSPENKDLVSNITRNASLEKAFRFIPGQALEFLVIPDQGPEYQLSWEVQVDAVNLVYIFCARTNSRAWLKNDGDIHYFTHFEGNKSSLLFRFFLGAYKIPMGYYPGLVVRDRYPVNTFNNRFVGVIQDFFAPFVLFTHPEYNLRYSAMEDALMQSNIRLVSEMSSRFGRYEINALGCEMYIGLSGLESFVIRENDTEIQAKRLNF
jgi:urea transporter/murein DD-endopeptidase MepM/ murein hydrolase activator NlpD